MGILNDQMLGTHYDYLILLTELHSLHIFAHNQFNVSRSSL